MRARLIGGLPADLVDSLTGLTHGRFPVAGAARYAQGRRATSIFARRGAAVVAVQNGRITKLGVSEPVGRFVRLQDVYGNTYTYGHLKQVARAHTRAHANAGSVLAAHAAGRRTAVSTVPAASPSSPARGADARQRGRRLDSPARRARAAPRPRRCRARRLDAASSRRNGLSRSRRGVARRRRSPTTAGS